MPTNMFNKITHIISFGLILVYLLWPAQGFGSVYEDLRNDKEAFRLPLYPPDYLSGPQTPRTQTPRTQTHRKGTEEIAPMEAPIGEGKPSRPFHGGRSQNRGVISPAKLASGAYSLSDLDTLALERNAGIKAAALNVTAARDGYSQVRELDDILLQYTAFTEGLKTGIGPQKGQPMPNTQFPYPGTRQLKSKVVGEDVRMARNTLEIRKRDTLTRLRKVFWEYVYQHGAEQITADVISQMAHLREVALRKYQTGTTTYYDVVRVDTRLALLKNERVSIRRKAEDLAQALLTLLNLPGDTPIAPPASAKSPSTLPAFDTVLSLALDHRQELDLLQARIDRMVFMVQAAETMILPGYSLNFSDFEDRISQAGPDAAPGFKIRTMAAKGVGTPMAPFSAFSNSWLRQTKKEIAAMEAMLDQEKFNTAGRVKSAWVTLDRAIREAALYEKEILPLSRSALEVALKDYESGRLSFPGVNEAYTQWLDTRLALISKQTRIGIAQAGLDQATGISGQTQIHLTNQQNGSEK